MNECKIVQDLLPLYAEDLISPETKAYVDAHCEGCEVCAAQRERMCADLNQEETNVSYRKSMRWSIIGIVIKTLLVSFLAVGGYLYMLWECGIIDKQVYEDPNGNYRFEVQDCDAGFFDGGACIVTHEGRDINLFGNQSYQDFQVWYHPEGKGYFACITYEDHQDTWLCLSAYDEELGMETNRYYPSGEIADRDFFSILRESEDGQKYLTEDAIIEFDRWSEAGRFSGQFIYFNYMVPGGWSGEIIYDVVNQEVKDVTCVFTMPPGSHGVIVH